MAKKIGILTFHNAINYGAVLQTLALQYYLENNLQCKVEIINLTTEDHLKGYSPYVLSSKNKIKNAIFILWNLLFVKKIKMRNKRFISFKENKLHLTSSIYKNAAEIEKNCYGYDILVTGSDQVFHPHIKNRDAYYLHFCTHGAKRVAYAPSFGLNNIGPEDSDRITSWARDFDFLSCREKSGAALLTAMTGQCVPVVCDPVFLPSTEFWESIATSKCGNSHDKYIFMFDLNGGQKLAKIASKLSHETHLPVVVCTFNILQKYSGFKKLYDLGPLEWLGWIRNATYVVTDSFHGSALGLKLNKKVISYVAMPSTAGRLITLFQKLEIEDQLITSEENFSIFDIQFKDYSQAIESFTSNSKDYLSNAISK